jgi:HEAT repeat protein
MARRLSLDERMSSLRRLRELGPSPEAVGELRSALRDKSNLIVATAAAVVGDEKYVELAADLIAAFERFMVDPVKTDKLCRAKIAIVEGLDKLEDETPDVFVRALKHVQLEPVWGGQQDTAAPLRAAAIIALARMGYRAFLPLLIDALIDPQKEVRIAAAQALGDHGTEAATLLLRLKARVGDDEPDVISECLFGLLSASPKDGLPFVAEFLDSGDLSTREAALLALGRSRLVEAFDALKSFGQKHPIGSTDTIHMAMAMLRLPIANDFLLETVAGASEKNALSALSALWIYRYDPTLRERITEAVHRSGRQALRARLERDAESDG